MCLMCCDARHVLSYAGLWKCKESPESSLSVAKLATDLLAGQKAFQGAGLGEHVEFRRCLVSAHFIETKHSSWGLRHQHHQEQHHHGLFILSAGRKLKVEDVHM